MLWSANFKTTEIPNMKHEKVSNYVNFGVNAEGRPGIDAGVGFAKDKNNPNPHEFVHDTWRDSGKTIKEHKKVDTLDYWEAKQDKSDFRKRKEIYGNIKKICDPKSKRAY